MLYTVATSDWSPDRFLAPPKTGLYRWRSEADPVTSGGRLLAVALRYDPARGVVVPEGRVAREKVRGWTSAAFAGPGGEVRVLAPIPAPLVRVVGPAEIRVHSVGPRPSDRARGALAGAPMSPAAANPRDSLSVVPPPTSESLKRTRHDPSIAA